MVKKSITNTYVYSVGRRKSAIATVKLFSGKGDSQVNKLPADTIFPSAIAKIELEKPFKTTDTSGKYHFTAKVFGGGKVSQLTAVVLAISGALKKGNAAFGPALRTAGLLTVDSRVRERRMVGTGGKARRQKQSPKR